MKRLQDLGASCFVLDLRDNYGGLVQVYGSVSMFMSICKQFIAVFPVCVSLETEMLW